MKNLRLILTAAFSQILMFSFAQNVGIGITTPLSKLHIKGSADASQLCIDANTVQGNSNPLIKLRDSIGNDLMWIHADDSTNVFIGVHAGSANIIGPYPESIHNTAIGADALKSNFNGFVNTAIGARALYTNIGGFANTATGVSSLRSNLNGNYNTATGLSSLDDNIDGDHNSAFGVYSLDQNTTGNYNTANGSNALYSNIGGGYNTATGANALYTNTAGSYNNALGLNALQLNLTGVENTGIGAATLSHNTNGHRNTALGNYALDENTDGNDNTAIGYNAGNNISTGSNNTVIGSEATFPIGTASNQVRIGNNNVTYAGVEVDWTITSDRRRKSDIRESNLGLDFISKLRPVSYYRTNDESKKREYGFIAQELEEALNASGAADNGIISKDDNGWYGVRYNDLMTPMVKAIQELSDQIKTQQQLIDQQNLVIENLLARIDAMEKNQ